MDYLRDKSSLAPSGTPHNAAAELVAELDEHLAAHSVLFHQYLKHAWLASTPTIKTLMQEQGSATLVQLEALADDIVHLGGIPISGPCEHENLSYLTFEREGLYSQDAMLRMDLNAEETVVFRLDITVEMVAEREVLRTQRVLERAKGAAAARGRRLRRLSL